MEPFFKYISALSDLDITLDNARLRAYEIKGAAQAKDHNTNSFKQDLDLRNKQIRSSIHIEITQMEAKLLETITALEKIKNSDELTYDFTP